MACEKCEDFATEFSDWEFVLLSDFKTSAAQGCSGCSIIATGTELCRLPLPDFLATAEEEASWSQGFPADFKALDRFDGRIDWSRGGLCIEFFIPKDTRLVPSWPRIGPASPVPESTGSEASLQQLDEWLNRCRQQHKICGGRKSYTPRRVLDLGDLDHPPNVRLHEPTPGEELEYLCLSYRWSATPALQTLKSNVDDHKLGIPWDRLPLAFQHVCKVARRLHLRYVWIDALCIVQDDEDDKVLDIAVMDSIFEGGVLTIVSAWASGPEQGLFGHIGDFSHHEFPATTKDGVSQTLCVRRELPHFKDGELPCLKRGWIYQELVLSPRLVFFINNEIVWQCQEHTECQCSPQEQIHSRVPNVKRDYIRAESKSSNESAASDYWWDHVEAYSRCQLTNPSDKLPAIQGLASRMESQLRLGRYIYGGWENSLLIDLVWITVDPFPGLRGKRPATWRAPTWSWASIDGAVWNKGVHHFWMPLAAVSRVAPEPRGVAENRPRGRITLDCDIRVAWLRMERVGEGGFHTEYLLCFDELDPGGESLAFDADWDLGLEAERNDELWCVKILKRLGENGRRRGEFWLVLRKAERDFYKRVGGLWNGLRVPVPGDKSRKFKEIEGGWKRKRIHLV